MTKYEIRGIKARTDFSYVIKNINEEIGRERVRLRYDREKGVLVFSIKAKLNPFELNSKLTERGLELKILE